jgi:hypothetical protein
MGLGGNGALKAKTESRPDRPPPTSGSGPDWLRRALDR